jgi:hypothetical protein
MSDPQRFCEGGGGALEKELVDSIRDEAPSPKLRRRVEGVLGLAAGTATATAATSALGASKAAQMGTALAVAKWIGGAAVTGLAATTIYVAAHGGAGATPASAPSAIVGRPPASVQRGPSAAPPSPTPMPPASVREEPPPSPAIPAVVPAGPVATVGPASPPVPVAYAPPTKPAPTLGDELRILDDARAAMNAGDNDRALASLDRHDREFADPALAPEAMALRVEVYARRGDRAATTRLASRFLERFGDRPEAQRVRSLLDGDSREPKP